MFVGKIPSFWFASLLPILKRINSAFVEEVTFLCDWPLFVAGSFYCAETRNFIGDFRVFTTIKFGSCVSFRLRGLIISRNFDDFFVRQHLIASCRIVTTYPFVDFIFVQRKHSWLVNWLYQWCCVWWQKKHVMFPSSLFNELASGWLGALSNTRMAFGGKHFNFESRWTIGTNTFLNHWMKMSWFIHALFRA